MKDEEGCLRDIASRPDEPAHRLAFADWLEGQGRFAQADGQRARAAGKFGLPLTMTREIAEQAGVGLLELQMGAERTFLEFAALHLWDDGQPFFRMGPDGPILTPEMRANGVVVRRIEVEPEEPWEAAVRAEIEQGVAPYLTAVIERPRDTASWLTLADWLDGQGHWLGPLVRRAVNRAPDYPALFERAAGELLRLGWTIDANLASGGALALYVERMQISPRDFPSSARLPAIVLLANCLHLGPGWGWF
jgi:uncharacterized protein (TIGR02996 family)